MRGLLQTPPVRSDCQRTTCGCHTLLANCSHSRMEQVLNQGLEHALELNRALMVALGQGQGLELMVALGQGLELMAALGQGLGLGLGLEQALELEQVD